MPRTLLPVALTVAVILFAFDAEARSFRLNQVPNPPNSCNTCHTAGGGTARNSFGLDVERTLAGRNVDWAAVCGLDSDGDGASNGRELGDPNCTWRSGDPNPGGPVFDPADAQSTPPPAMDAGVVDSGPADTGSSDTGSSDTGSPGPADTGSTDTGSTDTGSTDTGSSDTGSSDTGSPDAGPPLDIGASADTGASPDAGAAPADAGSSAPDAGDGDDGDDDGGCTCAAPRRGPSEALALALLLPFAGLALRRRR